MKSFRHASFWFVFCLGLLACAGVARAAMQIQVTGGGASRIPIALPAFTTQGATPVPPLTDIISDDLLRTGQFKLVDTSGVPSPTDINQVDYSPWLGRGAQVLTVGSSALQPDGHYNVNFRLLDVGSQSQLLGYTFNVATPQWRATAHKIADLIYQKMTGIPGIFATRIAYIQKQGAYYELRVADADGANPQTVLRSRAPLISPAFSPGGHRIAYVSFETNKPVVFAQDLRSGRRWVVANFKGSNSAPAWAPDGRHLAVTLTLNGNSQIYSVGVDGGRPTRLSHSDGIDTEADYSNDGKWIYFTSDRGGSPQIYRMPADGGPASRVTFQGGYNVSPNLSPDGKYLVYVTRMAGEFNIALLDLANGQVRILTNTAHDESPHFAPNGQMIIYATKLNGRGILSTVTLDGRTRATLSDPGADAREPAWGPL